MIHKASQPSPDQLSALERQMAAAIMSAARLIQDETVLAEVRRAIEAGDVQGAIDAIRFEIGEHAMNTLIPIQLRTTYEQAGSMAAIGLTEQLRPALAIRFDIINPESVAYLRDHAAELIREFGKSSMSAIRSLLMSTYETGLAPAKVARLILESGIGLTQAQVGALMRFRAGLIEAGKNEATVAKLVTRMHERALRYRARLIARTEIIRAEIAGQRALWQQAVRQGLIDPNTAMKEWLMAEDERTCPFCEPLDHVKVLIDEPFPEDGDGPPLHPACRCALRLVLP